MTESTTAILPPDPSEATPPDPSTVPEVSPDPTDVLMNAIVTLLAPFFLAAACEDVLAAQLAAWKTVAQYRPQNHVHLIAIAQIIACSLAGVGSISLAIAEGLSLSMSLRLRANAAALFRAAEQARRVLHDGTSPSRPARIVRSEPQPEPNFIQDPNQEENEANLIAAIAATQKRAAETLARIDPGYTPPQQAAVPPANTTETATVAASAKTAPTSTAATTPAPTARHPADKVWQARWGSAMADVAQEFTDSLKDLSPAERALAIQRSEALNKVATTLLSGKALETPEPGNPKLR